MPGGGLRAVKVNTKYYKDNLAVKLNAIPESAGSVRLYRDCDEDFRKQLLSEVRDEKGNWKQVGSRANHYLDCWVLANCAADHLGVKHWPKPDGSEEIEKETESSVVMVDSSFMGG